MQNSNIPVIIIQCCTNCKHHIWCARHNQWKYIQHFNQLKKKLEKNIQQCVILRNPIPDHLIKLDDPTGQQNKYFNQQLQQATIFPRLGSFEIYIYNILIFSKLQLNQWPNHNKLIQLIQNIIYDKKRGLDISKFSVQRNLRVQEIGGQVDIFGLKLPSADKNAVIQQKKQGKKQLKRILVKKQLKLPPANKTSKKQQQKQRQEKQKKKKQKQQIKSNTKFSKIEPNNQIQIPINNQTITPLKSQQSNITHRRTHDIQSFGSSKVRDFQRQYTYYRPSSERQILDNLNKTVNLQVKKQYGVERYRRKEQQLSETSRVDSSFLGEGSKSNIYKIFNNDFQSLKVNEFNTVISGEHQQPKAIFKKKNLEIMPTINQIVKKPKQRTIIRQVQIQIKMPKRNLVQNKQIQYQVNKSIIQQNKPYQISKPISFQINKQIIQEKAKILYHDGGIQVSDKPLTQYSQQMSFAQIPQQYIRQFHDVQIQGNLDSQILPFDKIMLLKQDVSVQPSQNFGDDGQDQQLQIQLQNQQFGINTDPIVKRKFQTVGINTQKVIKGNESSKSARQGQIQIVLAPKQVKKDPKFIPLGQRKKNIVDNEFYSLDRYQHALTKYRWIGRANYLQDENTTKKIFFKQKILFQMYRMVGIKCVNKQLSYQYYANNLNDQYQDQLFLHVMTQQIPEIKYFHQFNQFNYNQNIFPLSQFISLKQSRNKVTINKYGKLLAASRWFNDLELFSSSHYHIGFQMKNYQISEFVKILNLNYTPEQRAYEKCQKKIWMGRDNKYVNFDELSQKIQLQFIQMLYYIYSFDLSKIKTKIHSLQQSYGQFQQYFQQSLDSFIKFLDSRKQALKIQYQNQFLMYDKYKSFTPKINKFWKNNFYVQLKVLYRQKKILLSNCVSEFISNDEIGLTKKILIIKGYAGCGKTICLKQIKLQLQSQRIIKNRIVYFDVQQKSNQELKSIQKSVAEAQVILIDNFQNCIYLSNILKHFNILAKQKKIIITCNINNYVEETINSYFISLGIQNLLQCQILPFDDNQILQYTSKYVQKTQTNMSLDQINIEIFKLDEVRKNISNPTQLIYIIYFIRQLLQRSQKINIYTLIKKVSQTCVKFHRQFCSASKSQYKNVEETLKAFALKAFKQHKYHLSIKQFPQIKQLQSLKYVDSYIIFYPIDFITTINKYSFAHTSFFNYYASCAICQIIQKGFKGINIHDITKNRQIIQFIKQRYTQRGGQIRLIQIITQSKMNNNLSQQASNAITLLSKIGYIFSDLNLQGIQIPNADLSFAIFYNTNLKLANLDRASFFNINMTNTILDGCSVNKLDFGIRKYQSQTQLCCGALSLDGKYIALGSQNNLLLYDSDSGLLNKTLSGHTDIIRSVFFSRDQVSVISISDDKSIKIWNIQSGTAITLKIPSKVGVVFNLQAERICCANKQYVRVWSMKLMGGQVLLKGHTGLILYVCFNSQGTLIATSSSDKTAKLWTLNGQLIKSFVGHDNQVHLVQIGPFNNIIATASFDNTLKIWDISKGSIKHNFKFTQKISCMSFSPQQNYLVVAQKENYQIQVFNIKTYLQAFRLEGHQDQIIKLQFDKIGQKLVSVSSDKSVRVWNFLRFKQTQYVEGHTQQVWSVTFHKSNMYAASASADKTIKIWDIKSGIQLRSLIGHQKQIFTVAFSPIGTRIVSGGQDCTLRFWDIITGKQLSCLKYHQDWIYSVNFTSDGYLLASSDAVGLIVILDVYQEKKIAQLKGHIGEVYTTCFKKNNQILASGGSDKIIKIWNIPNKKQIKSLKGHDDNIWTLKFFKQEQLMSGSKDNIFLIWNYINGQIIKKINCKSSIQCISIINDQQIALALQDGKIKIINILNDKEIKVFRSTDSVWSIDISADNTKLIAGGADNSVRIYNLSSLVQISEKFYLKFSNLAYSHDGEKSVKLINSKLIMITDLIKRKQQQIRFDDDSIQSIAFSYNNNLILMKQNDMYTQFNLTTRKQTEIFNINEYNKDSSKQLLFCKGKYPRKFQKCSFKKLRSVTPEMTQIFQQQ